MRNIKRLLRNWEDENITLSQIKFVSVSELAAFINYAFNSLDDDVFEILMDELGNL